MNMDKTGRCGQHRTKPGHEIDFKGGNQRMLYWALVFLIVAIVAGVFGFGGVASTAAGIAKILFFVFLVVFLLSLAFGFIRRSHP